MVDFFRKLCKSIDSINEMVGRVAAWATAVVVLVVFVDVVMRYLFNTSYVFTQEMEWHLFGFIFLMGAGATLLKDGHVRVDIFYQRYGHRGRAWINLLGVIFFLVPGCLMIIVTSLKFVASSFAVLEGSPDPGGVPYRFILKSCIPAGFILVLIQGVALGIRSFFHLVDKDLDTGESL
jgi:TRAP-type mannitol/chloroaromatic compound transport system permease small subunit